MIISWYGEGCFKIQHGERVLLVDPPEKSSGLTTPRMQTDVIIRTLVPWPFEDNEARDGEMVYGAGEYDIQGIVIKGFALNDESGEQFIKTAYVITVDDVRIGIAGHVSQTLPPAAAESFEELDVLIAPAGGEPFMSQEAVVRMVKQLNPKVFIPSFYKIPGLKRSAKDIKPVLEEFNGEASSQDKFVFKKKDIADIKKTTCVCLHV